MRNLTIAEIHRDRRSLLQGKIGLLVDWTPLHTPVVPSQEGTKDVLSPRIGVERTGELSFCTESLGGAPSVVPEDRSAILQKREGGEAGCTFPTTPPPGRILRFVLQVPTFSSFASTLPFQVAMPVPLPGPRQRAEGGGPQGVGRKSATNSVNMPFFNIKSPATACLC